MELIVDLFDIVDKSIKMVVDLYYEYGSRDEDAQFDSDVGGESDDESQGDDEQKDSDLQDVDVEYTDSESSED